MRFSLDQARDEAGMEPKRIACAPQAADAAQASDLPKAVSIEAPSTSAEIVRDWGH